MKRIGLRLAACAIAAWWPVPAAAEPGTQAECQATGEIVLVCVGQDFALWVNGQPATPDTLGSLLQEATGGDFDRRIFMRVERDASYERVMQIMEVIQRAGFPKIALIAEEVIEPPP